MNKPVEVEPSQRQSMIVGLDDSDGSRAALKWALAHTAQLGAIQPVVGWRLPWWATAPPAPGGPPPPPRDFFSSQAHELAERQAALIPASDRLPPIVANGHAGRSLCAAARAGDVIVVGSRGRGAILEAVTGSTGSYCAAHCQVPVVIVPESAAPFEVTSHVVVGVDGSKNAIAALTWAIDHCPPGARVEAVHAFVPGAPAFELVETYADVYEQEARSVLETSVERAVHDASRPATEYDLVSRIVLADPRQALAESEADLIVVGARGHRGVAHLLLGSVATALTHQTGTTTVVVPSED